MKQMLTATGVILLTFCLYACNRSKEKAPETTGNKGGVALTAAMKQLIKTDTVRLTPLADVLKLSGNISFNENDVVKIYPTVSGLVTETRVSLGDRVTKGQTLAIIRSADIAGNYSDLNSANADIAVAKRNLDNTQQLYNQQVASERELTEAQNNYRKAQAAKDKIDALLSINGYGHTNTSGQIEIKAPADGYVVEKKVNANNYIRADMGDNLFTLSGLQNVWAYANVYEADISRVKTGNKATLSVLAYPDKIFHTTVNETSNVLDSNNVERVRFRLDNPGLLLKPDMFCNITVYSETGGEANAVPSGSVVFDNSKNYVLVYNNDHNIQIREVQLLKQVGDITYIREGLKTGETVISQKGLLVFNAIREAN